MANLVLSLLSVIISAGNVYSAMKPEVGACYWGSWFSLNSIDAKLCTHVIFSFMQVGTDYRLTFFPNSFMADRNKLQEFTSLRMKNPDVKLMVAVGGASHSHYLFNKMADAPDGPMTFAKSVMKVLKDYSLDGIDMDWEYPKGRIAQFSTILRSLRAEIKASNMPYLLTLAVAPNMVTARESYDFKELNRNVDYVFVMAYDFAGAWWPNQLDHNSDLAGGAYNVIALAKGYTESGISKDKIVIGVPLYVRKFRSKTGSTKPGTPSTGGNQLTYTEICNTFLPGASYGWDSEAMASYLYKESGEWISYESKQSLCYKIQWLQKNGFRGFMVWEVTQDDAMGHCADGKNSRLSYLKEIVNKDLTNTNCDADDLKPMKNSGTTKTMSTIKSKTTKGMTMTTKKTKNFCDEKCDGLYPDKTNGCRYYYRCHEGVAYHHPCPANLLFDDGIDSCNYKSKVTC